MNIQNIVIGLVAVVGLVFGFLAYNRAPAQPTPPLGAISGSDFPGPSMSLAGLYTYGSKIRMNATASTTCSFRSPTEGSSTLQFASYKISSTTSNALLVEIGKGSLDATTTLIGGSNAIGANLQGTIIASSSPTIEPDDTRVFAPGQWLNFKTGGAAAGGIGGTCTAEFQVN